MANDKNLIIKIDSNTSGFTQGLEKAKSETAKLQKNLSSITKKAAIGFAAVSTAIGGVSFAFARFQQNFTQVETLLDKSSFATKTLEKGTNDLKKGILSLRAASGESFEDLNKGLFDLISAGIGADQALKTLAVATNLAAAGGTNVSVAVDALTTSISAFGLEASDAERVSQLFFLAQKNGKTTVAELANSMGVVAASADAFGVSLEEVLAATAAITNGGKSASQAMTGLNQVFSNIAKPTAAAAEEAARLGISFDSASLRAKGLAGFLDDLVSAEGFTTASIDKLFGSSEAMVIAFALAGKQNEKFNDTLAQLQDEARLAKTFTDALTKANATQTKAWNKMIGAIQSVIVLIGEALSPLVIKIADQITNFAKAILNADSAIIKMIKNALVWTAGLTAVTVAVGTLGLAVLALRNGLQAMGIAGASAWKKIVLPVTGAIIAYKAARIAIEGVGEALGISAENSEKSLSRVTNKIIKLKEEEEKLQDKIKNGFEFRKEANTKRLEGVQKEIKASQALQAVIQKEVDLRNQPIPSTAEAQNEAREAEKEAINALNEEKIEAITEQNEAEQELLVEKLEAERLAKEESRILEDEQEAVFNELADEIKINRDKLDTEILKKGLKTKEQLKAASAKREAARQNRERAVFLETERKHGKKVAQLEEFFNNNKVAGVNSTLGSLATLQQSHSKKAKKVGKIAAVGQAIMNTAQGVTKALASFPPPFNFIAAAATGVAGLVQIQTIRGANKGGMVTNGISGKDTEPFMLSKGEAVTPADVTPALLNTFKELRNIRDSGGLLNTITQGSSLQAKTQTNTIINETETIKTESGFFGDGTPQQVNISINIEDEAADFITAQQRENEALSIGTI